MRLHRQFENARRRAGWTGTEVAERSGVDQELVADFELGVADLMSDELDALAAGYGVSLVAVPGRSTTAASVACFVNESLAAGRKAAASRAVARFERELQASDAFTTALVLAVPPDTTDDHFDAAIHSIAETRLRDLGLDRPDWMEPSLTI